MNKIEEAAYRAATRYFIDCNKSDPLNVYRYLKHVADSYESTGTGDEMLSQTTDFPLVFVYEAFEGWNVCILVDMIEDIAGKVIEEMIPIERLEEERQAA